jgi:hypothetical protein
MKIETKMPDGSTVISGEDTPPPPFPISKPILRRKLRDMGAEPMLDAFLDSDPLIRKDWDTAPWLMSDDEMLVNGLPDAAAAIGVSMEVVQQLLEAARMT